MKWGILAIAALAGFSASGQSIDVNLTAVDIGRYSSSGDHTAANQNYLTGRAGGETYAGFAVFSVPDMAGSAQRTTSVTGPFGSWQRRADLDGSPLLPPTPLGPAYPYVWEWVGVMRTTRTTEKWQQTLTGANLTLSFANPGTMTSAGDTLTVFDVSTPASQVRQGGVGKTGIYEDLSGGTQFGGVIPPAGPFSVALNADAGAAFTAVAQTGGLLTLGLSLPGAQDGEFLFGFTGNAPIGVTLQGSAEGVRTDLPTEIFIQDVADVAWVVNGPSRVPLFAGTLWYTDAPGMEPGFTPTIVPEPMAAPLAMGLLALGYGLRRWPKGDRVRRSAEAPLPPLRVAALGKEPGAFAAGSAGPRSGQRFAPSLRRTDAPCSPLAVHWDRWLSHWVHAYVTKIVDGYLRRQRLALKTTGGTNLATTTFGYDTASRLTSVSDGTNSATYAYLAKSPLLDTVMFKQNGVTHLTTTRQYHKLNRLQSIGSVLSGANQLSCPGPTLTTPPTSALATPWPAGPSGFTATTRWAR